MGGRETHRVVKFPSPDGAPEFETGSDVEIARALVAGIKYAHGDAVYSEGAFFVWADTHWNELREPELRRMVHGFNGAVIVQGRRDERLKINKSRVDGALHEAAAMLDAPSFFDSPVAGINCANGLLTFDTTGGVQLHGHAPDHRRRHCLPARFDPGLEWRSAGESLLAKLLRGCFAGEADAEAKIDLFAEIAGAAALGIGPRLLQPKCVVLLGETAENGKSQFLKALKGLVPASAVCTITPQQMGNEQYRAQLAGKLLNVSDELGMASIESEAFKAIITGEAVTAKTVYRPPFSFQPAALHVFATNRLPPFRNGMDRGVRRRLLPIVFTRRIPLPERIEGIGDRIANEEADLLLALAIDGAQRLLRTRTFNEPESSRQALAQWFLTSDPVTAFLQDEDAVVLSGAKTDRVTSKAAYAAFQTWARKEGILPLNVPEHGQFTLRVKEAALPAISIRRRGKTGNWFHGMQLTEKVTSM
jgi:P4 family phage/plasmid primase-like protien